MTTVKYQCKRCYATITEQVEPDRVKRTMACPFCKKAGSNGRMRLVGLPPATGWRTKSQRSK